MPRKKILGWIRRAQAGDNQINHPKENQTKHPGDNQTKVDLSTTYRASPYLEICMKSHKIIKASPEFTQMAGRNIIGTNILDACPHLPMLEKVEALAMQMIKNGKHISSVKYKLEEYVVVVKKKSIIIVVKSSMYVEQGRVVYAKT